MRAACAVLLLLASAPAYAAITVTKRALQTQAHPGGTVAYAVDYAHQPILPASGIRVTDATPAGHTLLELRIGAAAVTCPGTANNLGPVQAVSCDASGFTLDMLPSASSVSVSAHYRLDPSVQGTSQNTATLTCTSGCTPSSSTASTPVAPAPLEVTKTASVSTVKPGGSFQYTITVTHRGEGVLQGVTLHDALPAGVTAGGLTSIDRALPPLQPNQAHTEVLDVVVAETAAPGPLSNVATATAPGGAPAQSSPAVVEVSPLPPPISVQKTIDRQRARIGEQVAFTITVTPSSPQAGPIRLIDDLDPALKLAAVHVDGQPIACGGAAVPVGVATVACGAGRPLTVEIAAGQTLVAPLRAQLEAVILPTAPAQLQNVARLEAGGQTQTSTVTLSVEDAAAAASVLVTAGKVAASKGDLVPFAVTLGVPRSAAPLAAPRLVLGVTTGLRPGDVRIVGPDGATTVARPEERSGALSVPLPPLPAGTTATVIVRARLNERARLGGREVLAAQLVDGAERLAGSSAGVRVIAEPEFDLGTLVGDVYRDENGNGVRDRGEPGIEGVTVVLDDGLQAVTDADGRYHLAAIRPGDRALKVATHTLPPGSRLTTDDTRIVYVSPGLLVKIDHGVKVPAPEPPLRRPAAPQALGPEVRPAPGGALRYRLTGQAQPGARVLVDGRETAVDPKTGAWSAGITLARGRTRVSVVTAWPDGRVVVAARDVFWVERREGHMIVPREEAPRLTLRFPAGALAEPQYTLEGAITSPSPLKSLTIAGQALVPDDKGKVAIRLRLPEAGAGIPVDVRFADGLRARFDHVLSAGGDFFLLVGLAEGKLGYVVSDGAAASSGSGLYAQGRVKLYTKGRIKGRYLLEGGLDVDSAQIADWRDLFRGDPQRIFRNLDPDRFYTVYGDASQTTQAAQSRARIYVRIQIDRSELVFGNLQTGLTGVEFGRYARAVTGGKLSFIRAATEPDGRPTTQIILFGAWLQTARAHDELRGTGGSLYYLSHKVLVEGGEQVRIEVRDRVSDRPVASTPLRATIDYEIDYLAGRIILREPLSSVTANPTLVRSSNIDGDKAFLVVDYEYLVEADLDDGTVGARATQTIGPVRLGGTVVNEFRSRGGYSLIGADLQIDLKKYGVILGEYAHSYGSLSSFSRSDDGGLTYRDQEGTSHQAPGQRQGFAWKGEADLHFFGVRLHPYARGVSQGFTDTAHAQDAGYIQWGIDTEAAFWKLRIKAHYDERRFEQLAWDASGVKLVGVDGEQLVLRQTRRDVGGEVGGTFGIVGVRLGVRSERIETADVRRAGGRTTLGARLDVRVLPKLTLYGAGQYAVEKGGGQGLLARDNSLGAIGLIAELPWQTRMTAEGSYGVLGAGGLLSLKSDLGPGRTLYGTVTLSQDREDRLSASVAAGGRERITDKRGNARAILYAEDQFRDGPLYFSGRAHVLATGLDVPLSKRLLFGATFERGTVSPLGTAPFLDAPPLERTAGSLHAAYTGDRLRAQLRGEVRHDQSPDPAPDAPAATRTALQWLASGMVTWRPHKDLTLRSKVFLAHSTGAQAATLARSTEVTSGFAWRPSFTDRVALFGRYTFLDEHAPLPQALNAPVDPITGRPLSFRERAHVASIAADGRIFWRISLAEKLAVKHRDEPTEGTSLTFIMWVNRLALHVTKRWDAVVEYRLLTVPGLTTTHGVSLEANVIIVGHLRLGAGWNFADFSDNELTLGRGSEKGFFIRAQGFY